MSAMIDVERERAERQARQVRMTTMKRIVQNDQANAIQVFQATVFASIVFGLKAPFINVITTSLFFLVTHHYLLYSPQITVIQEWLIKDLWTTKSFVVYFLLLSNYTHFCVTYCKVLHLIFFIAQFLDILKHEHNQPHAHSQITSKVIWI